MVSSKKGVSAHQLHRTLEVTYKTAWFLAHRIREAMRTGGLAPFGSDGGVVEVDETYIGREPGVPMPKGGIHHKMKVLSLVERSTGRVRSIVFNEVNTVNENVAREAWLMTDEARYYIGIGRGFAQHGTVHHRKDEYVSRENPVIHTNTIEGYFSVFKRGMKGVY